MLLPIVKVIFFCAYACVHLSSSDARLLLQKNVSVSAVLVFGDSFTDQGNNNFIDTVLRANFLPYGKDFPGGKPTGRFSNGKALSDFLADALGVKEYLPASLDPMINDRDLQTGVSFGSAASGFDPQTTAITNTIPMSGQLDLFKEYIKKLKTNIGEEATNYIISNSVVVVVAGNNDLLVSRAYKGLQNDVPAYSNMLVKQVLDFLQEVYNLGVKRIVVFNAPPIGCLPALRTLGGGPNRRCVDEENIAAQLYNNILKEQLQFSASDFPQCRVVLVDYYNALRSIIENPQEYGFDVTDRGCCGTGEIEATFLCNKLTPTCLDDDKYFFWDSFHLSEKGNDVLVKLILQDLVNNLF